MNHKHLNTVLDQYVARWDELNDPKTHNEGYKWDAVSVFQKHWNADAEDFAQMFHDATAETSVLIDSGQSAPISGIKQLLKHEQEVDFVRQCFRELFSEDNGNLKVRQKRVEQFVVQVNGRIETYFPTSHIYPQTLRGTIAFLNLWRPEENYFYKHTEALHWADCAEFSDDFGSGGSFSLSLYYKMCDELRAELEKREDVMRLNALRTAQRAVGFDDSLHILVYDVIYCAEAYHLHNNMLSGLSQKKIAEKSTARQKLEQLESQINACYEKIHSMTALPLPNLVGETASHKMFGSGSIISTDGGKIVVAFECGTKSFLFPDAVSKGFLNLENTNYLEILNTNQNSTKEKNQLENTISTYQSEITQLKKQFNL